MATFLQLQQRVAHTVIDLPASVTAQLPTLINEAIRELQRAHVFQVCESTISATTVEGTRTLVSRPSNFHRWHSKPFLIEVDGSTRHLEWASSQLAAMRDFGTALGGEADTDLLSGHPVALIETDPTDELGTTSIEVYPLPDGNSLYSDGEYRIRIPYVKYLTALSADGSQNWFTNNAEEYIVFKASAQAFFLDWDSEKGTLWTQLATAKQKEVIMLDKKQRLSQLTELVPQPAARGSWLGRRDRIGGR